MLSIFKSRKDSSKDDKNKKTSSKNAAKSVTSSRLNFRATKKPAGKPRKGSHSKPHKQSNRHPHKHSGGSKTLKAIPLGGLEEVGRNMMALEYGNDIIVIDIGLQFPDEDMLGVDYVIPDTTYLEKNKKKIRGVLITHGHLDHIGAIPHILPKIGNPPIYSRKLSNGLIFGRLKEFGLEKSTKLINVDYNKKIRLGCFDVEFFHVNHSIPDNAGIIVRSPIGNIVHTGDFKFDYTPAGEDTPADFGKIAAIGNEGVLAVFIDSTNANKPGHTMSEKVIGENLDKVISEAKGRLIIASFSSLISRLNQIIKCAIKHKKTIFVSGRSMVTNLEIAQKMGYIKVPRGLIKKLGPGIKKVPDENVLVLTTGSQGESMSALTRMSLGEHAHLEIQKGDTIVFSSSPIPGNEGSIVSVVNNLFAKGAHVITNDSMDTHTSGHAHQEELKLMYHLLKPKFLIPVHGMMHMRTAQKDLAMENGMSESQILLVNNGDVIEMNHNKVRKTNNKVPSNRIIIDGLGTGDIGTKVIQERQKMAQNGVVVVLLPIHAKSHKLLAEPDVISRGFIYIRELDEVASKARQYAKKAYEDTLSKTTDLKELKRSVYQALSRFFRQRLNREPMILPIVSKS